MKQTIAIVAAFIIGVGIGYWVLPAPVAQAPQTENQTEEEDGVMCAQVITAAINPQTGLIQEFATPCDVPEGWEVVHNEIPGLELFGE